MKIFEICKYKYNEIETNYQLNKINKNKINSTDPYKSNLDKTPHKISQLKIIGSAILTFYSPKQQITFQFFFFSRNVCQVVNSILRQKQHFSNNK